MTGKYAYCSTVPRTFVQDCRFTFSQSVDHYGLYVYVLFGNRFIWNKNSKLKNKSLHK